MIILKLKKIKEFKIFFWFQRMCAKFSFPNFSKAKKAKKKKKMVAKN